MLRSVGLKTLHEQRRSLLIWAVSLVLLVGMYAGLFTSFQGTTAYNDVIDQMPKALRDLFTAGIGVDLDTGAGYVYMEMLSFMVPLLVLIYAVNAGSAAVAGEEERHTMDLLLATPVTRTRIAVEKYAAMAVGVAMLVVGMGAALVVFGAAADMQLSTANVAAAMLHLGMLGLVFGALALFVGAASGRVAVARGVTALVAVVAYVVNGFAPSVSWLQPVRKLSPFYQYIGHDPIRHGVSLAALGIAAATAAVLVAAAVAAFRRRDVG
jgi:ABC-2 type transport system permease protein